MSGVGSAVDSPASAPCTIVYLTSVDVFTAPPSEAMPLIPMNNVPGSASTSCGIIHSLLVNSASYTVIYFDVWKTALFAMKSSQKTSNSTCTLTDSTSPEASFGFCDAVNCWSFVVSLIIVIFLPPCCFVA